MNIDLNSIGRAARRYAAAFAAVLLIGAGQFPEVHAGNDAQGKFDLTGRVVRVADGDTITVLVQGRQQRVRLASIDAPEVTKDSKRPGQPFAQASRDALADLVAGKTLTMRCYERDRYERNICDVVLPGGDTANQRQVAAGMAWVNMEKNGRFVRDRSLPDLERRARAQRQGLWQGRDPQRPWEWRYFCWQKGACRN